MQMLKDNQLHLGVTIMEFRLRSIVIKNYCGIRLIRLLSTQGQSPTMNLPCIALLFQIVCLWPFWGCVTGFKGATVAIPPKLRKKKNNV